MPRIKRWFPVSHDINRDPEISELCRKFGVTGLRAWLEMLSIADRNEGALPGEFDAYPRILAGACESTTRHLREVCEWLTRWLRVDHEGVTRITNYGKYNKTAEHYPLPPDLPRPILNHSYKNKNEKPASPEPSAGSKKPKTLNPKIKKWADRIYEADPIKFQPLVRWIKQAQAGSWSDEAIAVALERFEPYCRNVTPNWWPYLDKILAKADKDLNAQSSLAEHEARKRETVETAQIFSLRGLVKDA